MVKMVVGYMCWGVVLGYRAFPVPGHAGRVAVGATSTSQQLLDRRLNRHHNMNDDSVQRPRQWHIMMQAFRNREQQGCDLTSISAGSSSFLLKALRGAIMVLFRLPYSPDSFKLF